MNAHNGDPGRFSVTPPGPAVGRTDRPSPTRTSYRPRTPEATEFSIDLPNNRAVLRSRVTSLAKGEPVERQLTTLIPDRLGSSVNNDFIIQNNVQGVFIAADNPANPRLSQFAAEEFSLRARMVRDSLDETTAIAEFHQVIGTVNNSLSILKANPDDPKITAEDADIKVEMAAAIRVGDTGNKFVFFNSGNSATHIVSPDGEIETVASEHENTESLRNIRDYTLAVKEVTEGSSIIVSSDENVARTILENRHPRISAQSHLGFYNIPLGFGSTAMDYEQGSKDVSMLIIDVGEKTAADQYLSPFPFDDLAEQEKGPFFDEDDGHTEETTDGGVRALVGAMGDKDGRLINRSSQRRRQSVRNVTGGALSSINNAILTGVMATGNFLSKHRKGAIGALGALGAGLVVAKYGFDVDIPFLPDAPDNLGDISHLENAKNIPGQAGDFANDTWDHAWNAVFGHDVTVNTAPHTVEVPNITTAPLEQWTGNLDPNTKLFDGTATDAMGESVTKFLTDNNLQDTVKGDNPVGDFHQFVTTTLQENGKTLEDARLAQPGDTFTINGEALSNYLKEQGVTLETPGGTETRHQNGNILYGIAFAGGLTAIAGIAAEGLSRVVKRIRR